METKKDFVNLHHYQGSFASTNVDWYKKQVTYFVRSYMQINPDCWEVHAGLNGYQASHRLGDLIVICFDIEPEFAKRVHNNRASIIFRGSFFDQLKFEHLKLWANIIDGVRCSRFDVYYQDIEVNGYDIFDLYKYIKAGNCKGFTAYRYLDSGSRGDQTGETLELGRRGSNGSGKFLRIYNKFLESKGEIPGLRWEVEFANKRAETAFSLLINADFKAETMAGMVFATCDWVEKSEHTHRSRMKRLEFYQLLIDSLTLVTVPCLVEKTNIEKKDKWMKNSVAGSLAYIRAFLRYVDGCNDGFEGVIDSYADKGNSMLKRHHLQQIQLDLIAWHKDRKKFFYVPSIEQMEQDILDLYAETV